MWYFCQKCLQEFVLLLKQNDFMDLKQLKLFEMAFVKDIHNLPKHFITELFHTELQGINMYNYIIIYNWIQKLFDSYTDETKVEMRVCIVNIVAVILGSNDQSNHLWCQLIEPELLDGTFLTGFMVCYNFSK